jgi:hypothetical protein
LKQNDTKEVDSVFDASFIKAWSTRDPLDNQKGYSDPEARVGRAGRTFGLGYKLPINRFQDYASFDLRFCFCKPERAETRTKPTGEDEAASEAVCSQVETCDS